MERKYVLHFPRQLVDKPIMSDLVKKYRLDFNILKAYVTPEKEGTLMLALKGSAKSLKSSIEDMKSMGVKVQSISSDVMMIKELCTSCTACVPLCPVQALSVDRQKFSVIFDAEKCIACGICIQACPTRAMVLKI